MTTKGGSRDGEERDPRRSLEIEPRRLNDWLDMEDDKEGGFKDIL